MGLSGVIKDIYDKTLGGTAPSGSASSTGDISQMIKYLVAAGGSKRTHVHVRDWGVAPATDYWVLTYSNYVAAASATAPGNLPGWGWVISAVAVSSSSFSGDFLSTADPGFGVEWDFNTASCYLASPQVFGGANALDFVTVLLGSVPTKLIAEGWFQFTAHLAGDESGTGFGFFNNTTGAPTQANSVAMISANATVFRLGKEAATFDSGLARDTTLHKYKIVIDQTSGLTEWFIDGASQGTIANCTDRFPASFGGLVAPAGTSRFRLWPHHIWYEA